MKKLLALFLVVALTLSAGLTALASEPKAGGTLRYAVWSSPKGIFNPSIYTDVYDGRVNQLLFPTLLSVDAEQNFIPVLADRYEISPDNLTLTFYLNDKAKWDDGEPLTAADVAFTIETICAPTYTGPRFGEVDQIVGAQAYHDGAAESVTGIQIIDDHTISFTYADIYAPALAIFAGRGILPKHIWEKVPVADWDKATDLMAKPVGAGPFKFVQFVPDQYVELVRNDDYFLGAPYLEKFILKVSNQDTAQAEMISGQIDIAMVSSPKNKDLEVYTSAGIKVDEYAGNGYQFMAFNNKDETFGDKTVRQAFVYAINRQVMIDKLLDGHGTALNAPLVTTSWAYPSDLNTYDYNPEKAKELLAQAGFVDTDKDGILDKDGKPFKIELLYPLGNKTRELSAPIIQQNLKDIGVEVELVSMEFATLREKVLNNHDYQVALLGFSLEIDPSDAKTYWDSSIADKPAFNVAAFVNAESDALLVEGARYLDIGKRQEVFAKWARLMNEEVPFVFLYSPNEVRAYSPKLMNYHPFTFVEYANIHTWYFAD